MKKMVTTKEILEYTIKKIDNNSGKRVQLKAHTQDVMYNLMCITSSTDTVDIIESNRIFRIIDASVGSRDELISCCYKLAEEDNSLALSILGNMYRDGLGVKRDISKAMEYYNRLLAVCDYSKLKGSIYHRLGKIYYYKRTDEDYQKAKEYFEQAATNRFYAANNFLAEMYFRGYGVPIDKEKARQYWLTARNEGSLEANITLGNLYASEDGFGINYNMSRYYYESVITKARMLVQAGEGCDINAVGVALNNLGYIYFTGLGIEKDIERGVAYFEESTRLGSASGMFNLGFIRYEGSAKEVGYLQNIVEARRLFSKSAHLGYAPAEYMLGHMYKVGAGGKRNIEQAIKWLRIAGYHGIGEAFYELGEMYENGHVIKRDIEKAVAYYEKGNNLDNPNAQCALGRIYSYKGLPYYNQEKALEMFTKSAEAGNPNAQYELGVWYKIYGNDIEKALNYLNDAAQKGQPGALEFLGYMYNEGDGVEYNSDKANECFAAMNGNTRKKAI